MGSDYLDKNYYGRIKMKHDVESNWNKATNFTPLVGEPIAYDPDSNHAYTRFKIGDGVTNVNLLPFIADDKLDVTDVITNAEIDAICV